MAVPAGNSEGGAAAALMASEPAKVVRTGTIVTGLRWIRCVAAAAAPLIYAGCGGGRLREELPSCAGGTSQQRPAPPARWRRGHVAADAFEQRRQAAST